MPLTKLQSEQRYGEFKGKFILMNSGTLSCSCKGVRITIFDNRKAGVNYFKYCLAKSNIKYYDNQLYKSQDDVIRDIHANVELWRFLDSID